MTLTKSFVKIYQTSGQPVRSGLLSLIRRRMKTLPTRLLNQKGMSLPEVVVSVGVMSIFMSVCCGSVTQYQTAFSSVEKSMNYSQNLHVALNFVARELADSEIETFVDNQGVPVVFPVELPKSVLRFRLPRGTDAHGSIIYGNEAEYKLVNGQLIRTRFNAENEPVESTIIANNVANLRFGRVVVDANADPLENAIYAVIESKEVTRSGGLKAIKHKDTRTGSTGTGTREPGIIRRIKLDAEQVCFKPVVKDGIVDEAGDGRATIEVPCKEPAPAGKSETVSTIIYLANYGR